MKHKLLLVGAGGLGRVVLEHAQAEYSCAFLDDGKPVDTTVDGARVVGNSKELVAWYPEYALLLVTIGNNALRKTLYDAAAKIGYAFPNIIVPSAYVSPHAVLGSGLIILNNAVVQNGAHIGSGTILNPGVEAHHDSMIGSNCLIYTNSVVRSLACVGDCAWIGSTVTITTSAVVPAGAVIPDGTVVSVEHMM